MSRGFAGPFASLVGGLVGVIMIVVVVVAIQGIVGDPLENHAGAKTAVQSDVPTAGPDTSVEKKRVELLPCFGCHNIERYRTGEKFPHKTHLEEGIGHCHMCHAFSGHFQVTIRRETCEECH